MSTSKTDIAWTDRTWNPIRGCSRVSEGCRNCYAERMAARFSKPGKPFHGFAEAGRAGSLWTGRVELVPRSLDEPLRWRKPQRIFVNSMSDLFHESLPDDAIAEVFGVMAVAGATSQVDGPSGGRFGGTYQRGRWVGLKGPHTFQVLTKRPKRMSALLALPRFREEIARAAYRRAMDQRDAGYLHDCIIARDQHHAPGRAGRMWPLSNVMLGVSVEDQRTADERIPLLLETPAAVRFVSLEPQLELVQLLKHVKGGRLHWVIQGGESGPGARPFSLRWARHVRAECASERVAYFLKQVGRRACLPSCADPDCGHPDCDPGWLKLRDRKGADMSEWPHDLRVREFPK